MELILSEPVFSVLDRVSGEEALKLCLLSTAIRGRCLTYLRNRVRNELFKQPDCKEELGNPNLEIDSVSDYIRLMSQGKEYFVTQGSEDFIGVDEALWRATLRGNHRLINSSLRSLILTNLLPEDVR